MGNCQAVDNAGLILQTQNGRAERFYAPVSAADIMKLHPGHHVALLLTTTTFYSSNHHQQPPHHPPATNQQQQPPLRVTRIKLLRPTDNLSLGHAYRLITSQEVMKGLKAKKKKLGKLDNYKPPYSESELESATKTYTTDQSYSNCESAAAATSIQPAGKTKTHHQTRSRADKHRPRTAASKSRGWHPSLNSISELGNNLAAS